MSQMHKKFFINMFGVRGGQQVLGLLFERYRASKELTVLGLVKFWTNTNPLCTGQKKAEPCLNTVMSWKKKSYNLLPNPPLIPKAPFVEKNPKPPLSW